MKKSIKMYLGFYSLIYLIKSIIIKSCEIMSRRHGKIVFICLYSRFI